MMPFEIKMMMKRNADIQGGYLCGEPDIKKPHVHNVFVAQNNQLSLQSYPKTNLQVSPLQLSGIQASMFDLGQFGYI